MYSFNSAYQSYDGYDVSAYGYDDQQPTGGDTRMLQYPQPIKLSTDSSLAHALGAGSPSTSQWHDPQYSPNPQSAGPDPSQFATVEQGMCTTAEQMSCVEYGESDMSGFDSPNTGPLSPLSPVSPYATPSQYEALTHSPYGVASPGYDYSLSHYEASAPSQPHGLDSPFRQLAIVSNSRSYTLESAMTPVTPPTAQSSSHVSSTDHTLSTSPAPALQLKEEQPRDNGLLSPSRRSADAASPTNSVPGVSTAKTGRHRPALSRVKTSSSDTSSSSSSSSRDSRLESSQSPHAPLSSSSQLSLASIVATTPLGGMDEIPIPESEAKPGQAVFKLHTTTPLPVNDAPPKKKPIMACLFCRERKICCGPPPPDSPGKPCKQCARRGLECVFPKESRRGQHKRSPRAVRVQALAEAHLQRVMPRQISSTSPDAPSIDILTTPPVVPSMVSPVDSSNIARGKRRAVEKPLPPSPTNSRPKGKGKAMAAHFGASPA
ncbi:hypothetical protein K474DRAFT_1668426 [Panus rudis PR-1116 ss-1]|nr:hypothetical protein K474DRAFT_1668426 [Panus rudis PR-1116 ss-1]